MDHLKIFSSECISITKLGQDFYIESFQPGLSMQEFNRILSQFPLIQISDFMIIKNTLLSPPQGPFKFGIEKDRIGFQIAEDMMKAYFIINISAGEIESMPKQLLIEEIQKGLQKQGIVHGIKLDTLITENLLVPGQKMIIAEGTPVKDGANSEQKLRNILPPKAQVDESGKVDYFQLNLITRVEKGDWLGEWTDPTKGIEGIDVKGAKYRANPGKSLPIPYDKNSVLETRVGDKNVLVAGIAGALRFENGKLTVSRHMEIEGDVDFKTGNIEFDGNVTIKGTIMDSFSVTATKDIEIFGKEGVGAAHKIISKEGSIIIQGGISGKNKTSISAGKDVILKYVSDAEINAGKAVRLASYALNANIKAREVIVEGAGGQIIGGKIQAITKVVSPNIGSNSEVHTHIVVTGIHKDQIQEQLAKDLHQIESLKFQTTQLEKIISPLSNKASLTENERKELLRLKETFKSMKDEMKELEDNRKRLNKDMGILGEGEITASRMMHPNVLIEIKGRIQKITETLRSVSFYVEHGNLVQK